MTMVVTKAVVKTPKKTICEVKQIFCNYSELFNYCSKTFQSGRKYQMGIGYGLYQYFICFYVNLTLKSNLLYQRTTKRKQPMT